MLTFEAGKDVTLSVPLTFNDEPAVPDPGTAVLTVQGPDGSTLYTENLTTGPTDHMVITTVDATHNAITTSFSRRAVIVAAYRAGIPFSCRVVYRLIPQIPYTVQPSDVRAFLGVNESELPDADIDLTATLLELEILTSRAIMTAALTSGEAIEIRANQAILYKTILDVIPSLANRAAQEESDGALTFKRHARKDFSELRAAAEARLSDALAVINPTPDPGYPLLITTTDPDPITG